MAPKYAIEIIDRTLRDLMNNDVPFGGKIVILGGDLRQLLPVLMRGTRSETLSLSIIYSNLWHHFKKYTLTQNMRALPSEINFSKFILDIGNGILNDNNDYVQLPESSLIRNGNIAKHTFGKLIKEKKFKDMSGVAILSARNADVDRINKEVVELLDSEGEHIQALTVLIIAMTMVIWLNYYYQSI